MTTPTQLPVPSKDPRDLLFNAEKMDEAVNSLAFTYVDRFGIVRQTLAGAIASIAAINNKGAWTTATLYAPRDIVSVSGTWYICVQQHVSGATFAGDSAHWRVYQGVTAADLAATSGAALVGCDVDDSGAPDRTVQKRIHRDYIFASDIGGADPTGTVDNRAILLAAKARGKLVRLDGAYRCDGDMPDALVGFIGDGPRKSRIIFNGSHGFTFSNGVLDRRTARFENFAVDSLGNSCDSKFVFYVPGVASGAVPVSNSALTVRGVEVGRFGRFGGFGYFKDLYRLKIYDCGATDLSRGIQLVGSVVQAVIRNFEANNDGAATELLRYGLSTESASYGGSDPILGPENLQVDGFKFVRCARGINHTYGLFARFDGLDTEADEYGALLNARAKLSNSLVAPGTGATAWTGVSLGVAPATPAEGYKLEDVEVNMLRAPSSPSTSYGIDIGNGANPVLKADLHGVNILGKPNSLQIGIRGRDLRSTVVTRAAIKTSAIIGDDINLTGRRLYVRENDITDDLGVPAGTITLSDGGDANGAGHVANNQCATLNFTPTTPARWSRANPDVAGEPSALVGTQVGTFTATLTGCTTSPTGTVRWERQGRQVTLQFPVINGTSNSTAATLTGMPSSLFPARAQNCWGLVQDVGVSSLGKLTPDTGGVITLSYGPLNAAFTNTGVKGVTVCTITYSLD